MSNLYILKQILYLLAILLVSWILIHFMAVFGIFLAVAIPILHLLFYPRIICFWCQIRKHPETHAFSHSLMDSFLVIILTAFSIGIIFGEGKILQYFGFPSTPRSVSFIIPERGQFRLEEIFPMKIEISGIKTPVNTVQADISFDPSRLEIVDITTDGSFASVFLQKEHSNELGYARLTGGLPNPGFTDADGLFGTVYFRGKKPGLAQIHFLDSSLVLANDGRGTNVLKGLAHADYLILPESISEEQQQSQKEVIIRRQVLGQETENTSAEIATTLELYNYTDSLPLPYHDVLGTSDEQTSETPQLAVPPRSFHQILIEALAKFDTAVVRFWEEMLNLFE